MSKSPDAFRTISEVAEWLGIQAHVLRFWESKFSQVKPVKRAGGRRYYRPNDMKLLGGIKKLLHDDGITIKGVQKILRENGVAHVASLSQGLDETASPEVAAGGTIIRFQKNDVDRSQSTQIDMDLGEAKNDPAPAAELPSFLRHREPVQEAESPAAPVGDTVEVLTPPTEAAATPSEDVSPRPVILDLPEIPADDATDAGLGALSALARGLTVTPDGMAIVETVVADLRAWLARQNSQNAG